MIQVLNKLKKLVNNEALENVVINEENKMDLWQINIIKSRILFLNDRPSEVFFIICFYASQTLHIIDNIVMFFLMQ